MLVGRVGMLLLLRGLLVECGGQAYCLQTAVTAMAIVASLLLSYCAERPQASPNAYLTPVRLPPR